MFNFDKKIKAPKKSWSFDGDVEKYFDEHIAKSVPFYKEVSKLISLYSDYFVKNNCNITDIGCSTGTLLRSVAKRYSDKKNIKFLGLDISKDMIKHAKSKNKNKNIKFISANINEYKHQKSAIFYSIYTLQFIKPKVRQDLINTIYKNLEWGGGFFLFEKVRGSDARFQDMMNLTYNEYKLDVGFKPKEILDKTRSLVGVMEPFSSKGNIQLLKRAGFKDIETIFRYNCFEGFLAIK